MSYEFYAVRLLALQNLQYTCMNLDDLQFLFNNYNAYCIIYYSVLLMSIPLLEWVMRIILIVVTIGILIYLSFSLTDGCIRNVWIVVCE